MNVGASRLVRQVVPHVQSQEMVTIVYVVSSHGSVAAKGPKQRAKNKRVGVTYNISYHFIVTAGNSLKKIVSSTKTVNKGTRLQSFRQ